MKPTDTKYYNRQLKLSMVFACLDQNINQVANKKHDGTLH